MKRILVYLFSAAASASVIFVPVFAHAAADRPVGSLSEHGIIRLKAVDAVDESAELFSDTQTGTEKDKRSYERSHNIPDFYNYGGHYAYDAFDGDEKADAYRKLYDSIYESCRKIAGTGNEYFSIRTLLDALAPYEVPGGGYAIPSDFFTSNQTQFINYDEFELSFEEAVDVYNSFRNDHPEFYWLPGNITALNPYLMLLVDEEYTDGSARVRMDEQIDDSVEDMLSEVECSRARSDHDKVKLVHDMIIDEVDYGYYPDGITPLDTAYAHSIVGVFDDDKKTDVVCEGYAKAFQLLLNALDIDNIYVTGLGYSGIDWGGHAWNMVRMDDGEYYYFDVTWDDIPILPSGVRYDYFACGKDFQNDHRDWMTDGNILYVLPEVPDHDYIPSGSVNPAPPYETPEDTGFTAKAEITPVFSEETESYSFEINYDNKDGAGITDCMAIAAVYDKKTGVLNGIKTVTVTENRAVIDGIELDPETEEVKILSWRDDLSTPFAAVHPADLTDPETGK